MLAFGILVAMIALDNQRGQQLSPQRQLAPPCRTMAGKNSIPSTAGNYPVKPLHAFARLAHQPHSFFIGNLHSWALLMSNLVGLCNTRHSSEIRRIS